MIVDLIKKAAKENRERIAYRVGEKTLTYGKLWDSAERAASLLKRQGNEPVILYGGKETYMPTAILACLIAHRAYVPVDRFMPEKRVRLIIEMSGASLLIGDRPFDGILCSSLEGLEKYADRETFPQAGNGAYIIFTSGTTGEPKGVPISRANLENFVVWLNEHIPANKDRSVILNQASFSFDLSVADFYYALTNGYTLTAIEHGVEYSEIYKIIREHRVNLAVMTPTFMKLCLADTDFRSEKYPDLECVYFCGETLDSRLVRRIRERFPDLTVLNAYGPTEATSAVSLVEISGELEERDILPVGRVGEFATDVILEDGEIVLRGASVFGGYLGHSSDCRSLHNVSNSYRTGDRGYIDNGYLYCTGRADGQIKYKGYRIEIGDIEKNIASLSGVGECAVVPRFAYDGSVKSLAAFVVPSGECGDIRARLRAILPEYMIPKTVTFLDRMPVTDNGKTDRKALMK